MSKNSRMRVILGKANIEDQITPSEGLGQVNRVALSGVPLKLATIQLSYHANDGASSVSIVTRVSLEGEVSLGKRRQDSCSLLIQEMMVVKKKLD